MKKVVWLVDGVTRAEMIRKHFRFENVDAGARLPAFISAQTLFCHERQEDGRLHPIMDVLKKDMLETRLSQLNPVWAKEAVSEMRMKLMNDDPVQAICDVLGIVAGAVRLFADEE